MARCVYVRGDMCFLYVLHPLKKFTYEIHHGTFWWAEWGRGHTVGFKGCRGRLIGDRQEIDPIDPIHSIHAIHSIHQYIEYIGAFPICIIYTSVACYISS